MEKQPQQTNPESMDQKLPEGATRWAADGKTPVYPPDDDDEKLIIGKISPADLKKLKELPPNAIARAKDGSPIYSRED